MIYGIFRVGRIHLRIEGRDFHRHVHDWEKIGILAEGIGPALSLCGKAINQIEAARSVIVSFLLADDGFTKEIDGKSDPLFTPFPERPHDVGGISACDELS